MKQMGVDDRLGAANSASRTDDASRFRTPPRSACVPTAAASRFYTPRRCSLGLYVARRRSASRFAGLSGEPSSGRPTAPGGRLEDASAFVGQRRSPRWTAPQNSQRRASNAEIALGHRLLRRRLKAVAAWRGASAQKARPPSPGATPRLPPSPGQRCGRPLFRDSAWNGRAARSTKLRAVTSTILRPAH
jgi:hypothetical protein